MPAEGWHALVIGTWRYQSSQFEPLRSPERDIPAVCEVLSASHVGGYQVQEPLENVGHGEARGAVARFFSDRKPHETCLVYISGHGVKNQDGSFYFAMSDTDQTNDASRRATTLAGEFLLGEMRRCRAGTIVALLDCCYSGAILSPLIGTKGTSTAPRRCRGWAILTAAGSGEPAAQETAGGRLSLWTEGIVHGLDTGRAADEQTGLITVDDLHRYAYAWVQQRRPEQHPHKWVVGADYASILIALGSAPTLPEGVRPPPVARPWDPEPPRTPEPSERVAQLVSTLTKLSGPVNADSSRPARRLRDYLASELAGYGEPDEQERRYEQALHDLGGYLEANPDDPYAAVARRLRGDVQRMRGAYKEALVDLDACLAARPWDTVARRLRGDVLRLLGSYEEALADLDACLAARPRDADAFRIRGDVLRALGRYDHALRDLAQSLALRPDMLRPEDRTTHRIRGDLQGTVDRNRGTLDRLDRILERDPRNPAALRLRARAARMVGDYDQALKDLENLPDGFSDPAALRLRGEIFYARAQYREAVRDLRKVLERRPGDQIAASHLRSAEQARRRRQPAVARAAADPGDYPMGTGKGGR